MATGGGYGGLVYATLFRGREMAEPGPERCRRIHPRAPKTVRGRKIAQSERQRTGFTSPTIARYDTAPSTRAAHTATNASRNSPVTSTIRPVTQGATMPAKLPNMFCHPVHLPAAPGPARVWVMAQMLEVNNPNDRLAAISTAGRISVLSSMPPATKVLRTRVGLPPRAIHKSDAQPPVTEESATPQNGMEPKMAIIFAEK